MLQHPLDDALVVYRAQSYDPSNTILPSEGLSSVPLVLGTGNGIDSYDPAYVAAGGYLRFAPGQGCGAVSSLPADDLGGDFAFAILYEIEPPWDWGLHWLAQMQDGPTKSLYVHIDQGRRLWARVWNTDWAQVITQSPGLIEVGQKVTSAVTWNGAERKLRLFHQGAMIAETVSSQPRLTTPNSPLYLPTPGTISAHRGYSWAWWNVAKSAADMEALPTNEDWFASGDPPPPPGQLIVKIDDVIQPGATVAIDGVAVPPPTGPEDKVVEVETH